MEKVRLQKYLADAGIASRRKSEKLIEQGRVSVNGNVVRELGTKVSLFDKVCLDGKEIESRKSYTYIMLHKPSGYVTTVKDQFGRKCVLDLVQGVDTRVYPVGRLDYDTTGLLILTNDGDLTYKITHPAHGIEKTYIAKVKGSVSEKSLMRLENGVDIGGFVTSPARVSLLESKINQSVLEIVICEGRNRQVRKMCEAIGHPVIKLKRTAVGRLSLKGLREGEWRYLTEDEINYFK